MLGGASGPDQSARTSLCGTGSYAAVWCKVLHCYTISRHRASFDSWDISTIEGKVGSLQKAGASYHATMAKMIVSRTLRNALRAKPNLE